MDIVIQENSQYGLVVSSRTVARELGKRHCDVIRDIENIFKNQSTQICVDLKTLIIVSTYKDSRNRNYKEYLLTKDGFTLYMFNIQGYQDFKIAYIQKFNEMEKLINSREQLTNCCQKKLNYNYDFMPSYQDRVESTRRMIDKMTKEIEREMINIHNSLINIKSCEAGIKLYMLQI